MGSVIAAATKILGGSVGVSIALALIRLLGRGAATGEDRARMYLSANTGDLYVADLRALSEVLQRRAEHADRERHALEPHQQAGRS